MNNLYNKTCHRMNNKWFKECISLPKKYMKTMMNPWTWTVSIFAIGGLIGALVGGPISNVMGRKIVVWIMCYGFIIGYVLEGVFSGFLEMFLGRIVQGFAAGVCSGVVPMYLNEIAPVKYRGSFGVIPQLGVTFGIFVAQTISIFTFEGQKWRILLGWVVVIAVLQLIIILFLPYSPMYLIKANKKESAKKNFKRLRNIKNEEELEIRFEEEIVGSKTIDEEVFVMKKMKVLKHMIVAMGLHAIQQFSGINAIIFYSSQVFSDAKVPLSPIIVTAIVSLISFLSVIPTALLIEKLGRKVLILIGLIFQLVFMSLVTISMSVSYYWVDNTVEIIMGIVSSLSVILYCVFFQLGIGPIAWLMVGELFTTKWRSYAYALATATNWLCTFLVGWLYPYMHLSMIHFSFLPFIGVILFSIFFVIIFVKETKGKTIEQICK